MRSSVIFIAMVFATVRGTTFDQAIARIYQEKPHLKPEQPQVQSIKKRCIAVPLLINYTALCYALVKIYCAHRAIFKQKVQPDSGWLSWLCPSSLQTASKKVQFFAQACGICCEAFAYKILAQFLYYIYKSEFPVA